jgi:8-hydroxy-5-deazaflavin:NADPH oxidoreductase
MPVEVLAFIGGTGPEGLGLAARFAAAGHEIVIGSRSPERAQQAVEKIRARVPQVRATGMVNQEAVRRGEIVFVTIPFAGHRDTLEALAPDIGAKLVVDVVSPISFERGRITAIAVPEGSAAQQAQALLPQAQVVAAFHHLDASGLMRVERPLEVDVLVCADHQEAKERVMALAEKIEGVRSLDGGPLANSRHLEEFTVLLLNLNKTYKAHTSLRIAGIPTSRKG